MSGRTEKNIINIKINQDKYIRHDTNNLYINL